MPSKYRIRNYAQNSTYHISNLGLNNSEIFLDDEDYKKFQDFLQAHSSSDIELISYLLLPNHYHLLIRQISIDGVAKLLKKVINSYTYYFHKKYQIRGPLFAGKFKSVKIEGREIPLLCQYLYSHPGILWLANSYKSYPWNKFSLEITFDHKELDKKTLEEIRHLIMDVGY